MSPKRFNTRTSQSDLHKTRDVGRSFPGTIGDFLFFSGTFSLFVTHAFLIVSFIYLRVHFRNIKISSFSFLETLDPYRNNPLHFLSIYESHNIKQRPITNDRAPREVFSVVNGLAACRPSHKESHKGHVQKC